MYVGIENRYGFSMFSGRRDHSGLAYTSLMPRSIASLYCRYHSKNFYGSEHQVGGYRTYTHTPRKYASMFRDAGFGCVEVHGVYDGYNRQRCIYPLGSTKFRKAVRSIIDPPVSRKGAICEAVVTGHPWIQETLENDIIVFARRATGKERLAWSAFPMTGPAAQFSTRDKVFVIRFHDGVPVGLCKGSKNDDSANQLVHEYELLTRAESSIGGYKSDLLVDWPAPVGTFMSSGQRYYEYEFCSGTTLEQLLFPANLNLTLFIDLVRRLTTGYVRTAKRLKDLTPLPAVGASLNEAVEVAGRLPAFRHLTFAARAAVEKFSSREVLSDVVHGDRH